MPHLRPGPEIRTIPGTSAEAVDGIGQPPTPVVHCEHPGHARTAADELQFTHELTSGRELRQPFTLHAHVLLAAADPVGFLVSNLLNR